MVFETCDQFTGWTVPGKYI